MHRAGSEASPAAAWRRRYHAALLGILLQTALEQPPRFRGDPVPIRLLAHHRREEVGGRLAPEGSLARQRLLVEHGAERPDVRALVDIFPRACSGLMYAAVPRIIPACVACIERVGEFAAFALEAPAGSIALARPKSNTFTAPSARSLMFAGLRSRWMMPCSCAASSASAICFAMGSASSSGIGPRAMRCEDRRPRRVP